MEVPPMAQSRAFGQWCHGRLPWLSQRQAYRFMSVFERFGRNLPRQNVVVDSPSILYALAAPSTPDSVVTDITSPPGSPTKTCGHPGKAPPSRQSATAPLRGDGGLDRREAGRLGRCSGSSPRASSFEMIGHAGEVREGRDDDDRDRKTSVC